jgi:hypothetical protein
MSCYQLICTLQAHDDIPVTTFLDLEAVVDSDDGEDDDEDDKMGTLFYLTTSILTYFFIPR